MITHPSFVKSTNSFKRNILYFLLQYKVSVPKMALMISRGTKETLFKAG